MGLRTIIIVSFLISACESKLEPQVISINKTHKIQSVQSWETAEELRFMWTPPKGPKGNDSKWIINDDIMLFTPDTPGEYSISLIIENISGDVLGEEFFLLIAEKTVNTIHEESALINQPTSTTPKVNNIEVKKLSEQLTAPLTKDMAKKQVVKNQAYTIQVSSWPSLEEARKDQLSLTKFGIDAYTQRVFIKKKNSYWWRVRVGNFSKINQANIIKNQIESLRGSSVWIDRINEN